MFVISFTFHGLANEMYVRFKKQSAKKSSLLCRHNTDIFQVNTFVHIVLKNGQIYLKILRCSHRKIFTVCLAFF